LAKVDDPAGPHFLCGQLMAPRIDRRGTVHRCQQREVQQGERERTQRGAVVGWPG
jgi:hypothetical protein